jgi:anthranilate/para-aminobenzoate synthase component II
MVASGLSGLRRERFFVISGVPQEWETSRRVLADFSACAFLSVCLTPKLIVWFQGARMELGKPAIQAEVS